MKVHQETILTSYSITACRPGRIDVSAPVAEAATDAGRTLILTESFLISPRRLTSPWFEGGFERLTAGHLIAVLEHEPELVLIGSGATFRFPQPATLAPLYERGIGVEVMDSAAACRTFNLLVAEGRGVTAAVIV